ncbi:hypothetical protein BDY19DRAFT_737220 [Irpex rosettiformis]|uniref:Uncharacterized protein n=1 Tax=Irpex rosettiformis TaxID=378272 RepID=A0ACB8U8V0_9APHY|nr:hypothetical protein BDY19DRAFT_737220 [Irpex rosettiformis]
MRIYLSTPLNPSFGYLFPCLFQFVLFSIAHRLSHMSRPHPMHCISETLRVIFPWASSSPRLRQDPNVQIQLGVTIHITVQASFFTLPLPLQTYLFDMDAWQATCYHTRQKVFA